MLAVLSLILFGCNLPGVPGSRVLAEPLAQAMSTTSPTVAAIQPTASFTPFKPAPITPTPRPTHTPTLTPTPTPTRTATATLPPPPDFLTTSLRTGIVPQRYVEDACLYLERRWAVDGSRPGTVVVPIMYHGILKAGSKITNPADISVSTFNSFVWYAHRLGFETITTAELVDFMENNAAIPPRSMILIIDDRRLGSVQENFLPVLEEYDWTVTLAYITGVMEDWEWNFMQRLLATNRIDVQAHGWLHNADTYIKDDTSEEIIRQEIISPIAYFEENLGYRPQAFIWPGGDFNELAVAVAREAGYQVGFTVYSRGPVMYNWVPLGEPEIAMHDPMLVLPRAWSSSGNLALDIGVKLGDEAWEFAQANYPAEAAWFKASCGGELPPLKTR